MAINLFLFYVSIQCCNYSETCLKRTPTEPSLLSVPLIEVSAYCRFILLKIREEKLVFTEAGVCLMQGLHLIRGPLNTGFTVIFYS